MSAGSAGAETSAATDGLMLHPGDGDRITIGGLRIEVKVSAKDARLNSAFEVVVPPGFDVGAHRHDHGEELFYVLEGELDLLAFEPDSTTDNNWRAWRSRDGRSVLRAGPGSMIFVPPGCPHAFANPTDTEARMLFLSFPAGHEDYLRELSALVNDQSGPEAIVALRKRHGIEQLTTIAA
ncbi:cupin domain-containing protein [Streptomyces sp. NPDC026294]|uniref:cupin domain-containing protein n=1 Tax=Streptomyces sp. NPDC026294 TaxID=3155362 RepID=UPI0033F4E204